MTFGFYRVYHLLKSCGTRAAAAGLLSAMMVPVVQAQTPEVWPTRPIRLIVALAPGGLADVLTRAVSGPLGEALGQTVVVENRPGAGGNVAGAEVARNGRDDHTFLIAPTTTQSVNPFIYTNIPFTFDKDLQPVGLLANSKLFLLARPGLEPKDLASFIAYIKANPKALSFGSAGNGTTPHLAGELLNVGLGAAETHVPYRGAAPAIQDLMAGQIDYAFGPANFLPMVKAGKLRLLGVASRQRAQGYADVPTFAEMGVDRIFADSMFGIYAPASMSADRVRRFNVELNRILSTSRIGAQFAEYGAEAVAKTPAEFQELVRAEKAVFVPVVKALSIKAE